MKKKNMLAVAAVLAVLLVIASLLPKPERSVDGTPQIVDENNVDENNASVFVPNDAE